MPAAGYANAFVDSAMPAAGYANAFADCTLVGEGQVLCSKTF
ncbi:MAG: hypothetical protein V7K21_27240 [Nostoc sp.]